MYKAKYNIGDFNKRVTVNFWTTTQDAGGGASSVLASSFTAWAKVDNRSGGTDGAQQQQSWNYNTRFIIRTGTEIKSDCTITYAGGQYSIDSLVIDNEGSQRFYIINATKTDERV